MLVLKHPDSSQPQPGPDLPVKSCTNSLSLSLSPPVQLELPLLTQSADHQHLAPQWTDQEEVTTSLVFFIFRKRPDEKTAEDDASVHGKSFNINLVYDFCG